MQVLNKGVPWAQGTTHILHITRGGTVHTMRFGSDTKVVAERISRCCKTSDDV